ncbi:MAG: YitT family protein [Clostridiaceae bacterium]|nr:YitT family protein [Clostridiaceae bacterium]
MKKVRKFLYINLGLLLVACGIHFYKIPNHFATGGVSGISIILEHYIEHLNVGALMLIINVAFLILGLALLGWDFTRNTVYSSLTLSGMVWLLDVIFPINNPLTNDTLLELFFAIGLPGIGSAIVFNLNASTGGTDIIAKILNKYTNLDIGKALLTSDILIATAAGLVFSVRIGMYSVLGLVLKGLIIDNVIEGFNLKKQVVIVSENPEPIKKYIIENIGRGATIHTAYGAWTNEEKHIITSVMGRKQAVELRNFIRKTDKNAFITITNTSEIIGKGFMTL